MLVLAGCAPVQTRFEILSFKNQVTQSLFAEHFPDGAYASTAHKNTTLVFEIRPEAPADSLAAPPTPAQFQPAQMVRVEVFWKPRPGTTYADSTQTDANIAYCLITGRHAITYEGAGFVYFTKSRIGKTITGTIESSILVPTHTTGEPNDLFGPCHLRGSFIAHEDRKQVVNVEQRLRRSTTSQPVR